MEGKKSKRQLARENNVDKTSILRWVSFYKSRGDAGLITSTKNVNYFEEVKYAAVEKYIQGTASMLNICRKYNIRSATQLPSWILKYNSHEMLKSSVPGGKTDFKNLFSIILTENGSEFSNPKAIEFGPVGLEELICFIVIQAALIKKAQ